MSRSKIYQTIISINKSDDFKKSCKRWFNAAVLYNSDFKMVSGKICCQSYGNMLNFGPTNIINILESDRRDNWKGFKISFETHLKCCQNAQSYENLYLLPCLHLICRRCLDYQKNFYSKKCNVCDIKLMDMISYFEYYSEPIINFFNEEDAVKYKAITIRNTNDRASFCKSYSSLYGSLSETKSKNNYVSKIELNRKKISIKCKEWIISNYIDSIVALRKLISLKVYPMKETDFNRTTYKDSVTQVLNDCTLFSKEEVKRQTLNECSYCKQNIHSKEVIHYPCGCFLHESCFDKYAEENKDSDVKEIRDEKMNAIIKFNDHNNSSCICCKKELTEVLKSLWDELVKLQIIEKEMIFKYLTC